MSEWRTRLSEWWEERRLGNGGAGLDFGAILALGLAAAVAVGAWVVVGLSGHPQDLSVVVPSNSPAPQATQGPVPSDSPRGSASPDPSASPSPGTTSSPAATVGPQPPVQPGPTAESSSKPGAPHITLSQAGSRQTGATTSLTVHITDPGGSLAAYLFSFGVKDPSSVDKVSPRVIHDSGTTRYDAGEIDDYAAPCKASGNVSSKPLDTTMQFTRTFRVPGTYTAYVAVQTRTCKGVGLSNYGLPQLGGSPVTIATLRYTISGTRWVNGAQTPRASVSFERSQLNNGHRDDLGPGPEFRASDDGVITKMVVTWGDGESDVVQYNNEDDGNGTNGPCERIDEFGAPIMAVVARPDHQYANSGNFDVTVTVTSASCDGSHSQTTSTSAKYAYSAP